MSAETKIEQKTDLAIAGSTAVSPEVGGLSFKDMSQVMEFAKLMSVSRQAVPAHLRQQPGMCLAVTLQALNWRMDPFSVANKSYSVNDRIAYEAQLVQAVIEQRAPIKGRIKGRFEGEGENRVCVLTAIDAEDGETIEYRSPPIGQIKVKNSPLWKADPDQQLWYYSARAMCRRHFPDVLLGIYEKEELRSEGMKDVTPVREAPNLAQRLQAIKEPEPEVQEAEEVKVEIDKNEFAYAEGRQSYLNGENNDPPYADDEYAQAHWVAGYTDAEQSDAAE